MPKFDKPDSPNIIWGVNALDEDLTRPDDSYIQTGWTQVKPPYEYENYSMNKLYQGFAYYNQLGFPEWDSVTEYQAGKSYVQGSNNRVYKCIQTHTDKNPATAGNEGWWELFEGNRQATTASRGTVELATPQEVSDGVSSITAVTPFAILDGLLGDATTSNNGFLKIPASVAGVKTEFVVQWGSRDVTSSQDAATVQLNFPTQFPNTCFSVIPVDRSNDNNAFTWTLNGTPTTTSAQISFKRLVGLADTNGFRWIAIGY